MPLDWYDPLALAVFGDDSVAVATLMRAPPKPQGQDFVTDQEGTAGAVRFGRYLHVPAACEACDKKACADNSACTLDDCSNNGGGAQCSSENS